jgi:ferrochelatase
MRHWRPWIEDVVRSIAESGTRRAIALALAPQFSELSTARYWERIQRGLDLHRLEFEVERIGSYHAAAGLVAALAERTAAGLQHWTEGAAAHVVFTAHSLPVSSTSSGDPYQTEVLATATLVARHLGLPPERWSFAFQSAGRSAEPWLGPALDEHLESLAEQGVQRALVTPVGFVSDHVEVLYDIDVKAKATAERCGIELTRAATVGTHPAFISQLADLVRGVAEWQ